MDGSIGSVGRRPTITLLGPSVWLVYMSGWSVHWVGGTSSDDHIGGSIGRVREWVELYRVTGRSRDRLVRCKSLGPINGKMGTGLGDTNRNDKILEGNGQDPNFRHFLQHLVVVSTHCISALPTGTCVQKWDDIFSLLDYNYDLEKTSSVHVDAEMSKVRIYVKS